MAQQIIFRVQDLPQTTVQNLNALSAEVAAGGTTGTSGTETFSIDDGTASASGTFTFDDGAAA
jgi:hypothetical protein